MGISTKKQSTKETSVQDSTSSGTSTNNGSTRKYVPDWLLNPAQQVAGNVSQIFNDPASKYTPTVSGLQQNAFRTASGLAQSPFLDQAGQAVGAVGDIGGESVLSNLGDYYTPYRDQVLNPILNDYDEQSGITRARQAASGAGGAFRGSRFGLREGQTEGELARGRAATEGGLLSDMYSQATALSAGDADRRQAAASGNQQVGLQRAGLLQSLGLSAGSEDRANLGLQASLGATQTGLENDIRQHPITFAGQQEGLLQGLNTGDYSGTDVSQTGTTTDVGHQTGSGTSVTKSNPSLLQGLGQAAQIAAMFASDGRLKTNIVTAFIDAKGRRWVDFAYKWAPLKRFRGVIAQEVMKTDPQAVVRHPAGYLMVDYGALA